MCNSKANLAAISAVALVFAIVCPRWSGADVVINQFNSASEASQWRYDFGSATHAAQFDPTMDANANAASGSLKFTFGFDSSLDGDNKIAYTRDIAPSLDGTMFSGLSMDVMVDPSSVKDAFGANGDFGIVIRDGSGYTWTPQFDGSISSADGWRHISASPLSGTVNDIRAITIQLWGGSPQNLSGPVTMWIDNVVFTQPKPPLPGDANLDGTVDFNDLVILARHYGLSSGAMWGDGDFNNDGGVSFDDLVILARNYGKTQAAAAVQVPEPSSALLLAGVAPVALLRRRRSA